MTYDEAVKFREKCIESSKVWRKHANQGNVKKFFDWFDLIQRCAEGENITDAACAFMARYNAEISASVFKIGRYPGLGYSVFALGTDEDDWRDCCTDHVPMQYLPIPIILDE